jgi:hypothetical protein
LITQFRFKRASLTFGVPTDRRSSANDGVVVLHFAGARGRNQFGERFATDAGKREVNDVWVAEKIVEKWLNRFQRIGSTELKENYPHTP